MRVIHFVHLFNGAAFGAVMGNAYGFTWPVVCILVAWVTVYMLTYVTLEALFRRNR